MSAQRKDRRELFFVATLLLGILILFMLPIGYVLVQNHFASIRAHRILVHARVLIQQDGLPLTVDEMNKLTTPPTLPENAARLYDKIFVNFNQNPQWSLLERQTYPLLGAWLGPTPLSGVTNPLLLPSAMTSAQQKSLIHVAGQYVQSARAQFPLTAKAVSLPYCNYQRNWSLGSNLTFPEYTQARKLVRLLLLRAFLLDRAGKPLEALQQIDLGVKVAKQIGSDPVLIAFFVRCSMEDTLQRAWMRIVENHTNDPQVLRRAEEVSRDFGHDSDLRRYMASEALWTEFTSHLAHAESEKFLEEVNQQLNSPIQFGNSSESFFVHFWNRLLGKELSKSLAAPTIDLMEANMLDYLHNFLEIERRYSNDPYQALKAIQQLSTDASNAAAHAPKEYFLVSLMDSNYQAAAIKSIYPLTWARQRQLVLDLFKYRLQHHQFPKDLSAFPTEETLDPFNNRPMRYQSTAQGFVLTSVGERALAYSPGSDSEITVRFPPNP